MICSRTGLWVICLACVLLQGCARQVQWLIPGVAPVTRERCEALDSEHLGYKDGAEGALYKKSYQHWNRACASLGVPVNLSKYQASYQRGLAEFCGCERGFLLGAQDKSWDLQSQRSSCAPEQLREFRRGFDLGAKQVEDPSFFSRNRFKEKVYDVETIRSAAQGHCATVLEKS